MTSHDRMVLAGLEHGCQVFATMPTFEPDGWTLIGMMRYCATADPGFTHGLMLAAAMFSVRMRQTETLRLGKHLHLELVA